MSDYDSSDPNVKADTRASSGTFGDARRGDLRVPEAMTNGDLLAEYHASTAGTGDPRKDALAAAIESRGLGL